MKKFLIRIGLPRIKMLNKVLFVVGLSILATACVSPILLYEQLPLAEYTSGEMVLISVVDQRAHQSEFYISIPSNTMPRNVTINVMQEFSHVRHFHCFRGILIHDT